MDILKDMMQKTAGLRRPGSAALDLAYVASGRLDGFYEKGLKPWDIAAGALLAVADAEAVRPGRVLAVQRPSGVGVCSHFCTLIK